MSETPREVPREVILSALVAILTKSGRAAAQELLAVLKVPEHEGRVAGDSGRDWNSGIGSLVHDTLADWLGNETSVFRETDVPLLVDLLRDSGALADVRRRAAHALEGISDSRARAALTQAARRGDYDAVAGAFGLIVRLGIPGTEDVLIKALRYGDPDHELKMVETFLNSGNGRLENEATGWAKEHKVRIMTPLFPGLVADHGPKWGDAK